MNKKIAGKLKHRHTKMVIYLVAVFTIAMVIEVLILLSLNKKNSNRTSLVLLDQVVRIIEDNQESEDELIGTLKDDYMVRAQAVAYLIDSMPDAEMDVLKLRKIAELLRIDEIHLFDTTGTIYSGTEPKYYGYSFDSGEQMAYFKPMLEDKKLSMCQDVTPNTAEGKNMIYAITWNSSGDRMVQIGIEPVRLLEELRSNEISEVIDNMPTYDGIGILVADADTGVISGASDSELIGSTLEEQGIDGTKAKTGEAVKENLGFDGHFNYCNIQRTGDYVVVITYSTVVNINNRRIALLVEFIYLLIAGIAVYCMLNRIVKVNDEKKAQMEILLSMSDIYNSMHLIDLQENTVMEYNARDEITAVVKQTSSADEFMLRVMKLTTQESHLEEALEFTDLSTLAVRMQNKKTISEELMSKAIGWYRGSFITIEEDEEGYPTKVVYVTQNIDKQKKREEALILKSNIDELTGLYNRRAYEDDIASYEDKVTQENFVFASFDVNGLKKVNDSKGHIAGDELLVGAAECMKKCFEPYGKVYRVGGDEFAAIIFVSPAQLHAIKKDFENVTSKWSGKLVDSLSVSCGYVAKREAGTDSVHEMANIADKKMYEAKSTFYGRTSG